MLTEHPPKNVSLVTLREAARRAGRSYSWASGRAHFGYLEAYRTGPQGRILVSEQSLIAEIEADRKKSKPRQRKRTAVRSYLRLVVDNTEKKVGAPMGL